MGAGNTELLQVGQKHVEPEINVIHFIESKLKKLLHVIGANTGNYQGIYKDTEKKKNSGRFSQIFIILSSELYFGSSPRARYKVRSDQNALSLDPPRHVGQSLLTG